MTDIPRLLTDAYLRNQIQRAIRARMGSDLDISACVTADVMDIVGPALEEIRRERDAACDDVADQYDEIVQLRSERNAARAEAARESKLVSEARHERDTARQEARAARREAAALITGDRSDVLHWAVRQLRKIPMPTDAQVELVEQAEEIGRLRAQLAATTRPGTDTKEND